MSEHRGMSLSAKILTAMALGIVVGLLINTFAAEIVWIQNGVVNGLFEVVGTIFVRMLQMLVVPLVLISLVCGVTSLDDISKLGRMGAKTFGLYLVTTAIAVTIALLVAYNVGPGIGANFPPVEYTPREAPSLTETIINLVPKNPFMAMSQGAMLQVIVFAIILGLSLILAGPRGTRIISVFQDMNEVIMKMVTIIMAIAPYGVFALIAKLMATTGFDTIAPLAKYFFTLMAILIFHGTVVYMLLLKVMTGLNPFTFMKKMRAAQLFAFSTSSSAATIPVTMEAVTRRLGVKNSLASFSVPLGATINMDGTAIMQGVATVFIAQVFGIDLTITQFMMVVLTAVLASIGTAAVPGVGLITLTLVLEQVGLPVEGIALIIGVDRLLDMLRTSVNITGDATVSTIVGKSEGDIDLDTFNDPDAGLDFEEVDLPDEDREIKV
jgi:Na+/H+-dicarboxylate symporter